MGAITNIANAILLLCALFAVYEAYARGGDARMIGVAAAKFLLLGLIVSNYSTIFQQRQQSVQSSCGDDFPQRLGQ